MNQACLGSLIRFYGFFAYVLPIPHTSRFFYSYHALPINFFLLCIRLPKFAVGEKTMKKLYPLSVVILAFCLYFQPASAQKNNSIIGDISNCAKIKDNMPRLACFDRTVASLLKKQQQKEIIIVDASEVKKIKKEAFGFNIPSLPKLSLPSISKEKKQESLTAMVKSARKNSGKYFFTLDNGQVWREVGQNQIRRLPKGKLTVTIKPKSLGSYMIRIKGENRSLGGIRVKRVK